MNNIALGQMSSALSDLKIPHKFVGVIPFSHEITSDEPLVGREYLPYGSTLMTTLTMRDGLNWRGNYFIPETFRAEAWLKNRDDMLNQSSCTITEAVDFLKTVSANEEYFTRPCEDLKQYSGQVMKAGELHDWLIDAMECESSGSYKLAPETKIQICKPRNIQAEWRWFIVDGKVVSGSMYRREGVLFKKNEQDIATMYEAHELAQKWLPHRNCVMDLALVDNELKVLEFNTINSSGFYDHDVESIVSALWEDFKRGKGN
jgi:hypothetical protein